MYATVQKFGVGKISLMFLKVSYAQQFTESNTVKQQRCETLLQFKITVLILMSSKM